MNVVETNLPGVLIIEPNVFPDSRGFFLESWNAKKYAYIGIDLPFVQDNASRSSQRVLRGLHFQIKNPQGKLVRVTQGSVFDVAADINPESATFGQTVSVELSDSNHRQLYIPPGYAHGFCVLSDIADFSYKCTDFYYPNDEGGVIWDDQDLAIEWPIANPLVSEKDIKLPNLKELMNAHSGHRG